MVYIDFVAGAHGNYLEFVCNKFIASVKCNDSPFNELGASHNQLYYTEREFSAKHYYQLDEDISLGKVISISIVTDDLLPLSAVSFLRAGNHGIDNNELHVDTYHKLNNSDYQWVLDNLLSSYFDGQIKQSYDAVRDQSWPDVNTLEDFENLPDWIKQECSDQHNLTLLTLTEQQPDCPRYILREFFKISFKFPQSHGLMLEQQSMRYSSKQDVFYFPYNSFYDTDQFVTNIDKLSRWLGYGPVDQMGIRQLHSQFLDRQPYKDLKIESDTLLERLYNKEQFILPDLTLLSEAYISANLEIHYNKEITGRKWFKSSDDIYEYFK